MNFRREPVESAESALCDALIASLRHHSRVLWLVSGGSNIISEVRVMECITKEHAELLPHLAIMLVDERFGDSGHPDSNYRQLMDAGFDPGEADWFDLLAKHMPFKDTVQYYSDVIEAAYAQSGYVIATLGMGQDAHIAGILPDSPAIHDEISTVVGYGAGTMSRMTVAPRYIRMIDEIYLLAYGDKKRHALKRLMKRSEPVVKMPSGLLADLTNVHVYNDYLTSEV